MSAEGSFVDIRCMKRFLVVVVALFALTTTASAQSYLAPRSVGALEAELGVGLATAATDISAFGKMRQGVEVWAEARYNFGKTPVDLGVHFGLCSFSRVHRQGNFVSSHSFDSQTLMAVAGYNFFQGRIVSIYLGAGAGMAWNNINADGTKNGFNACVMPRIGVELANHLRITAAYKFYEKANNHLTISVGFVFGGGNR